MGRRLSFPKSYKDEEAKEEGNIILIITTANMNIVLGYVSSNSKYLTYVSSFEFHNNSEEQEALFNCIL